MLVRTEEQLGVFWVCSLIFKERNNFFDYIWMNAGINFIYYYNSTSL